MVQGVSRLSIQLSVTLGHQDKFRKYATVGLELELSWGQNITEPPGMQQP